MLDLAPCPLCLRNRLSFRLFLPALLGRGNVPASLKALIFPSLEGLETTVLSSSSPSAFLSGTCHFSLSCSHHFLSSRYKADPQNRKKKPVFSVLDVKLLSYMFFFLIKKSFKMFPSVCDCSCFLAIYSLLNSLSLGLCSQIPQLL